MPFYKVEANRAGAAALGILVPHGTRTLVVVRPRSLDWDLLPASWDGHGAHPPAFCTFTRDEAAMAARRFLQALEEAVRAAACPVQTFGDAANRQIWVRAGEWVWIACQRTPGQAYQPALFASEEEAIREAERVAAVVWPSAETRQEYYFNTQNFGVTADPFLG